MLVRDVVHVPLCVCMGVKLEGTTTAYHNLIYSHVACRMAAIPVMYSTVVHYTISKYTDVAYGKCYSTVKVMLDTQFGQNERASHGYSYSPNISGVWLSFPLTSGSTPFSNKAATSLSWPLPLAWCKT